MSSKQVCYQEATSNNRKKGKKKPQNCDLQSQDDIICDYKLNGVRVVSERVTILESSSHLNLVGMALCRKHYNKLIVNAKKSKKTNICCHPKHEVYLSTARKGTELKKFQSAYENISICHKRVLCAVIVCMKLTTI